MDNTFDKLFYGEGDLVAGVDESGVSDIAGPLVAACVILPKIDPQRDDLQIFEVNDSKKVPEKFRKKLAEIIWQTAIGIGIGEVQPCEMDILDRSASIRLAMLRAVRACKSTGKGKPIKPQFILVDRAERVFVPLQIPQTCVRDGDQKSLCVAAASIVAKVFRDDIMLNLHERFPFYDWASNKGAPCEKHFLGLDRHGIQSGVHRLKRWPFVTSANMPEKHVVWQKRRKLWREATEEILSKELGEGQWTLNPPSSKNLVTCKKDSSHLQEIGTP